MPLRSYEALHGERAVNDLLLTRVLYGISCRNYEAAAAAIPGAIGLSGSTVSRGFMQASAAKLRELQERDLSGEDVVAVVLDGKTFAEATMVIALGITMAGEKRFLGFVETDTENEKVLTPFLRSLVERGLDVSRVGVSFLLPPALLAGLSLTGGLGARLVDTRILEPMTAALLGAPLEAPQLRLWHGINTPLILSGVIVSLGFVLYHLSERRQVPGAPRWLSGDRVFERFLSGAQAVGAVCNRALAGASPSVYFALLLGSGFVFALPLTRHLGGLFNSTWDGVGVVILSILACALVLLLRLPSRLGRILAFTVVGFAVTVLYSLLNAPEGMSRALLKLSGSLVARLRNHTLTTPRVLTARRVPGGQRPARAYLDILAPGGTPSPLRAPRRPPSAAPSSRRASVSHGAARGAFG